MKSCGAALLVLFSLQQAAAAGQPSSLWLESRHFFESGLFPEQQRSNTSVALAPSLSRTWEEERATFDLGLFYRWDSADEERTHFDLRELSYEKAWERWELRLGVRKVFWGAAESRHLVDVINQTDLVEDIKGEEKLGQPMITATWVADAGTLELFYLPYFRERTFPGAKGRFRFPFILDESLTTYESSREEWHSDRALRWSGTTSFDYGVSFFDGTNREPELRPGLDSDGTAIIYPHYGQMQQLSLDIQYASNGWLWKFEGLKRRIPVEEFSAAVGGFEYTIGTPSGADWGLLLEYGRDGRTSTAYGLKDYMFGGLRISLNDFESTEILCGVFSERGYDSGLLSIEAGRKLAGNLKAGFEMLRLRNANSSSPLHVFRRDSYAEFRLEYFF